jgi:transposase
MGWFAGLDWGGVRHAVCVVDDKGEVVDRFEVDHDEAGLTELRRRLGRIARSSAIPIAIERPTGLVVDALVDAGHSVVPIHPNVVKACRPRYRAAGGKSDLGDAYLLADVLRTDGRRFPPLTPQSDRIKALRALVRTRDDLVAERVGVANQLRALLESYWPGAAAIFADVDSPIALAFVQRYSTPRSASKLGEKRLGSFLAQHQYCGRRPVPELLQRLRDAPVGKAKAVEVEAKGELVRMLARLLEALVAELAKLTSRIEHEVAQLGGQLASLERLGRSRLQARTSARLRPSPRYAHPRQGMDPRALARLDLQDALRPRPAWRRQATPPSCRLREGLTQEVSRRYVDGSGRGGSRRTTPPGDGADR